MGLPKASWLATLSNVASHYHLPCLAEGLRHAAYARWADNTYDGDDDENSRDWAAEAIKHYELAASKLCTAAGAASGAVHPCVCVELVARSDEAAARAAALRAELDHDSSGCCGAGRRPPVKEDPKWCTWGDDKNKKKVKCMCVVCVADRKGDGCACSSEASAGGGDAECTMVCVEAQPAVCATPAYACSPWYYC